MAVHPVMLGISRPFYRGWIGWFLGSVEDAITPGNVGISDKVAYVGAFATTANVGISDNSATVGVAVGTEQ